MNPVSHVYGPLVWNVGIFRDARREYGKLVLELADGTVRVMNYKNWDGTVQITEQKIFTLKSGVPILIATWGGYDPTKWFCDVRSIV